MSGVRLIAGSPSQRPVGPLRSAGFAAYRGLPHRALRDRTDPRAPRARNGSAADLSGARSTAAGVRVRVDATASMDTVWKPGATARGAARHDPRTRRGDGTSAEADRPRGGSGFRGGKNGREAKALPPGDPARTLERPVRAPIRSSSRSSRGRSGPPACRGSGHRSRRGRARSRPEALHAPRGRGRSGARPRHGGRG